MTAPAAAVAAVAPAATPEIATARYRWTVGLTLAVVQSLVYFGIGHTHMERSPELLRTWVDDAIPFWPWTSWCYLPFYAAIFIMAIGGFRTRSLFNRGVRSVVVVMVIGALCHIFIRAEYPRPVLHPPFSGPSEAFMAWVQSVDAPGNVFPSLHVAHTTMLAVLLRRDRPVLGTVAIVMATLLALSTMTTKQHFVADVVSGYALAFFGVWLAVRRLPQPALSPAAS